MESTQGDPLGGQVDVLHYLDDLLHFRVVDPSTLLRLYVDVLCDHVRPAKLLVAVPAKARLPRHVANDGH